MTQFKHIFDTITFTWNLEPTFRSADALGHLLNYESGLSLLAIVVERERKAWFGPRRELVLMICDGDDSSSEAKPLMFYTVRYPSYPNDLDCAMRVVSRLSAMARATADTLMGGQYLFCGVRPKDRDG